MKSAIQITMILRASVEDIDLATAQRDCEQLRQKLMVDAIEDKCSVEFSYVEVENAESPAV